MNRAKNANTANLFVDWGGEFHDTAWQACDSLPITPGQSTVFDLLQEAGSSCNPSITFTYQGSGQSAYLTGIDGVINNQGGNGYYWVYFVNGKEPDIGFGAYALQAGDSVAWDYKHFSSRFRQATLPESELAK